eukprot:Protomagalhaensia_sp_Gyna_25__5015@NODE_555_length_3134_cov_94_974152_g431_i0_p2_GENE_NODE_555_length_3134_cov_94_974152_g431_i0NODE_555_length_3134_cov_94_974152_g431_i0_p2_ORF_typecomplete_len293_score55_84Prp18/PF02840_15/5_8e03Prp18/PF02840_15/2_3e34PRP4/PF08799_11/0_00048PRP4/PF08799_11/1_2e04Autoind_bind/PF03472_15/0_03DUF1451/PF07295_11/1_2e03DUF1451/PF07295_11/0_079DUF1133/PF06576_11/0_11_NODE_555_length_3134_cov_94_974152_g431_i022213099
MKGLRALIGQQKDALAKAKSGAQWIERTRLEEMKRPEDAIAVTDEKKQKEKEVERQRLQDLASHFAPKRKAEALEFSEPKTKQPKKLPSLTEVESELRAHGQPKRLFGETLPEQFERLLQAEKTADQAAIVRESHRNSGSGDWDEDEALFLDSPRSRGVEYGELGDIPHDLDDSAKIKVFIQTCLKKWGREIDNSTDKETLEWRRLRQTFTQTKQHLKPLLKRIKAGRLEEEVSSKVAQIIDFCIDKEYVRAHDKYIELAIGNAAWPMGVTMVGIHERVGRSKIFSSEVNCN